MRMKNNTGQWIWVFLFFSNSFHSNSVLASISADSAKIKWNAEILFSKSWNNYGYSGHFYGESEDRKRNENFLTFSGMYDRSSRSVVPWFSPLFALSTGYFSAESKRVSTSDGSQVRNANGYIVTWKTSDTFGFSSIPFIPQVGFQIKPFLNAKKLNRLTLEFRFGYQINAVIDCFSSLNREEDQTLDAYAVFPKMVHTNTTIYRSFKESNFPNTYLQCGLSNLFSNKNNSRMGYKISYSWHPAAQKGLEGSLTYRLR